jgi:molybdopterin-guanine dinucleotide biosynthesis protein A
MIGMEAFVLAGGRSSRMGSEKGLVEFRGRKMIQYILRAAEEAGLAVSIIASDVRYREFGYPVYSDEHPGLGPLGGVYSALRHCKASDLLLLSCDIPLLESGHLLRLMNSHVKDHIIVACDQRGLHPLCAIYPVAIFREVEHRIEAGNLRMLDLLDSMQIIAVNMEEQGEVSPLFNFNSPADFLTFEAMEKNQVSVLSFGRGRDIIGDAPLQIPVQKDTEELVAVLHERYPELKALPYRISVNRVLISDPFPLKAGDEVALLPPFSGG